MDKPRNEMTNAQYSSSFTRTVQAVLTQGIRGFVSLLIKLLEIRNSPDGSTSSEN